MSSLPSPRRTVAGLVAATAALTLAACGPVKKSPPSHPIQTATFLCTEAAQTWTVPAGITQATFDLYGAQGGGGTQSGDAPGGQGGRTTATMPVTPGQTIQVNVGCQGQSIADPNPGDQVANGGFNGGGDACDQCNGTPIGAGGGASDVRRGGFALTDRLLVAGGGGGASSSFETDGGPGGQPAGGDGDDGAGEGGFGGDQMTGGDGGDANPPAVGDGEDGALFQGGKGGRSGAAAYTGGGGGGGYYGGGGGGQDTAVGVPEFGGGGGGGSSFGPAGATFATGVRSGNGLVTVTY